MARSRWSLDETAPTPKRAAVLKRATNALGALNLVSELVLAVVSVGGARGAGAARKPVARQCERAKPYRARRRL